MGKRGDRRCGLIGGFNLAGTVGAGWLTDRVDPRWLLAGIYLLRGVSLVVLPGLLSSAVGPALVGFAIACGVLDVATVPPTIALCRQLYGANGAIVFGWTLAAHQFGAGVLAYAGGVRRDLIGSYDPIWLAAAVLCGAATLMALAVRTAARPVCPTSQDIPAACVV